MMEKDILLKDGYTMEKAYIETKKRMIKLQEEMEKRTQFIIDHCPGYKDEVVKLADEFYKGRMVLCGTKGKPYFVGNPPKWSENPLNDNEFVWQLNRMEHWNTLIQAYYLTNDEKYGEKVLDELENWIDNCPPLEMVFDYKSAKERFSSVHPWRSLEVGIRPHRSWNYCLELLISLPRFDLSLFDKMINSLEQHGNILFQMCPIIWPDANHNHYLTECLGLLEIGGMLPFLKNADKWKHHALTELERCAKTQVTSGGGQIEGCPTYHHECLRWLAYSLGLMDKYKVEFSEEYKKRVDSMFQYSLYSSRPDGTSVPWGDSDSVPYIYEGAFYSYFANRDLEPLKQCASIFNKEDLLTAFYNKIWEMKDPYTLLETVNQECFKSQKSLPDCIHWDKDLKQAMIRTGWNEMDASVFFACRTPIYNDHAHIDPNGFDYFNKGIPILADPGRYNYQEGPDRKLFKGGSYHNTLLINDENAFEYIGTWEYGKQEIGDILNAGSLEDLLYVCGSHVNYFPVIHTRMLAFDQDMLVVIDKLDGRKCGDQADIYYNLNSVDLDLNALSSSLKAVKENRYISIGYSNNLECSISEGRISPHIDCALKTTKIKLNNKDNSRIFLTVFYVGKEFCEIVIEPFKDSVEQLRIEFRIDGKPYSRTWDYSSNSLRK